MARNLSGTSEEQTRFQKFRRNDHLSAVSAIGGSVLLVGIVTDTVYYSIGQPKYTTQSFSYIALVRIWAKHECFVSWVFFKVRSKEKLWNSWLSFSKITLFWRLFWSHCTAFGRGRRNSDRAGGTVKELRAVQIYKKTKTRYQLRLFLFSNDVELKNNTRNYRKPFWSSWVRQ